jgi:protein-S-isoprenylcysteine O-methyltransferase Ste14
VVRIQKDRGQTVVTTGPYGYVRHPGYAGGVLYHMTMPVMFNAIWGLIPGGIIAITFIVRTALDNRALRNELSGYKEYSQKVRYRLLPGAW